MCLSNRSWVVGSNMWKPTTHNKTSSLRIPQRCTSAAKKSSSISTPHLLTLPREVRNLIYSYLHRTLELRGIERMGRSQVFVRLENVPLPTIYCIHSGLRAEYHELGPISNLSALIFNRSRGDDKKYWSEDSEVIFENVTAPTHVKSVTLRISLIASMQDTIMTDLVNAHALKARGLRVIRVEEIAAVYISQHVPLPEHVDWFLWDRIHPLPHVLASLPIVQHINCREVSSAEVKKSEMPPCQQHVVWQYRAHLYSLHSSKETLWTKSNAVYGDSPCGFEEWKSQLYEDWKIRIKYKCSQVVA